MTRSVPCYGAIVLRVENHSPLVIATAVRDGLNHNFFLPAFQREFVWQPDNVEALFDSLMRGYPIGTFLLWQVEAEHKTDWEAYSFVFDARRHSRGTRMPTAGVSPLYLVLDGQQRLSSLLIGLRGSYATKKKHKRWDNPDSWIQKHLYLDLLKAHGERRIRKADVNAHVSDRLRELFHEDCEGVCEPGRIDKCLRAFETLLIDDELAKCYPKWTDGEYWNHMSDDMIDALEEAAFGRAASARRSWYGFRLMDSAPAPTPHSYWFDVRRILDFDTPATFAAFKRTERRRLERKVSRHRLETFDRNLSRLYEVIWKEPLLWCTVETKQDYERVVDIFQRANERGERLSKSELLLSLVTARWGDKERDDIVSFVDGLNKRSRNDFDTDFVMKTCLVLSGLPVEFKVDNFSNQNLDRMKERWPAIKDALGRAVLLVNSFGIDRRNLTSHNAVIPIAYFLLQHPRMMPGGSSVDDARNAMRIMRWLVFTLLNRVFGGQSDSVLRNIRKVLVDHQHKSDFPDKQLTAELVRTGKVSSRGALDLGRFSYGSRDAFLALTLLYDDHNWGETDYSIDHIYPQDIINKRVLKERSLSSDQQEDYVKLLHRVGNLELLLPGENSAKKATDPETWLRTRNHKFRAKHHYPSTIRRLDMAHFAQFVVEREKVILRKLTKILLPMAGER